MGIIIKPIVTEKLTDQGEKLNRYGFIVEGKANKLQIKEAVEKMYNVSVADVNTVNYHGELSRQAQEPLHQGGSAPRPDESLQEGVHHPRR